MVKKKNGHFWSNTCSSLVCWQGAAATKDFPLGHCPKKDCREGIGVVRADWTYAQPRRHGQSVRQERVKIPTKPYCQLCFPEDRRTGESRTSEEWMLATHTYWSCKLQDSDTFFKKILDFTCSRQNGSRINKILWLCKPMVSKSGCTKYCHLGRVQNTVKCLEPTLESRISLSTFLSCPK